MAHLRAFDLALVDTDVARGLGVITKLDEARLFGSNVAEKFEGFTHGPGF
jgi:hypothetical protein